MIEKLAKVIHVKKVLLSIDCTKITAEVLNGLAIGKGAHVSLEAVRLTKMLLINLTLTPDPNKNTLNVFLSHMTSNEAAI